MSKQTLVQLAFPSTGEESIAGYLLSPKLDGHRVLWVPHTRGMMKCDVQFANTTKDSRFLNPNIVCSGLWSRYGHPVQAPEFFLNLLPADRILDGEMGFGRGTFQQTSSVLKSHKPDVLYWAGMRYRIFDLPSPLEILAPREITDKPRNYNVQLIDEHRRAIDSGVIRPKYSRYDERYAELCELFSVVDGWGDEFSPKIAALKQEKLPDSNFEAWSVADLLSSIEVDQGGEGSIVRSPFSSYRTERSHSVLKIKPRLDAEATVIGWTAGKGKHEGRMGSLIVLFNGKLLSIAGFTDAERSLYEHQRASAIMNPGSDDMTSTPQFAIGSKVTFTFRELSDDGIPKEAQYSRKYNG